jgi:multidrug efflux pump subunit AcrA (membrane-fusion protein)
VVGIARVFNHKIAGECEMKASKNFLGLLILISLHAAILVGCSGIGPKEPSVVETQASPQVNAVISATGKVVPVQWARLSLTGSGTVREVLVQEDQLVNADQPLIRLEGAENLQASVAAAQMELVAARTALDDLYKDNDVQSAQAWQTIVQAQQDVKDAQKKLDNLHTKALQSDIDQANANVAILKDRLEDAIEDYKPYENKPEDNVTRAAYLSKKAQAQKDYDAAVRRLNNLLGNAVQLDIDQAEADLALAQARLDSARRQYDLVKVGPDPADVRVAQARLDNTQAQLAAAQAAVANLELHAPFSGTVSEIYYKKNEWVAPGQPVLLLADLANLQIETTDLNEIDAARVKVGDAVLVTFDALPEVEIRGRVNRISPKASEGSGVNYTVLVVFDSRPEGLRWGMTAFVDIQVES